MGWSLICAEKAQLPYAAWAMALSNRTMGEALKQAGPQEWAEYESARQESGEYLEILRDEALTEGQRYERATADVAAATEGFARAHPRWWSQVAAVVAARPRLKQPRAQLPYGNS